MGRWSPKPPASLAQWQEGKSLRRSNISFDVTAMCGAIEHDASALMRCRQFHVLPRCLWLATSAMMSCFSASPCCVPEGDLNRDSRPGFNQRRLRKGGDSPATRWRGLQPARTWWRLVAADSTRLCPQRIRPETYSWSYAIYGRNPELKRRRRVVAKAADVVEGAIDRSQGSPDRSP